MEGGDYQYRRQFCFYIIYCSKCLCVKPCSAWWASAVFEINGEIWERFSQISITNRIQLLALFSDWLQGCRASAGESVVRGWSGHGGDVVRRWRFVSVSLRPYSTVCCSHRPLAWRGCFFQLASFLQKSPKCDRSRWPSFLLPNADWLIVDHNSRRIGFSV